MRGGVRGQIRKIIGNGGIFYQVLIVDKLKIIASSRGSLIPSLKTELNFLHALVSNLLHRDNMRGEYKDHPRSQLATSAVLKNITNFTDMLMNRKTRQPTLYGWIFLSKLESRLLSNISPSNSFRYFRFHDKFENPMLGKSCSKRTNEARA